MMCDARPVGAADRGPLRPARPLHLARSPVATRWRRSPPAVLADAPPRFALAGLSMGGIVAMEVLRQAPARVERLALLDTNPLAEAEAVRAAGARRSRGSRPGGSTAW